MERKTRFFFSLKSRTVMWFTSETNKVLEYAKFHLSYSILLPRRADFWLPSPLPQRLYGREIVRWRHNQIFLGWIDVLRARGAPLLLLLSSSLLTKILWIRKFLIFTWDRVHCVYKSTPSRKLLGKHLNAFQQVLTLRGEGVVATPYGVNFFPTR